MHYERPPRAKTRIEKDAPSWRRHWRRRWEALQRTYAGSQVMDAIFRPEMVSTVAGTFDRILLTMPDWLFSARAYNRVYKDLFAKLPASLQYVIVIPRSKQSILRRWLLEFDLADRTYVVPVSNRLDFTEWAEDPYVIVQNGGAGESFFVEPRVFKRFNDDKIADLVSSGPTGLGLIPSELVFQGGNILIGDDFWFIGADHPRRSGIRVRQGETFEQTIQKAYGAALEANRRMYLIGTDVPIPEHVVITFKRDGKKWTEQKYRGNERNTRQPIFHIDMFITLAGRHNDGQPIVLVGDSRMADELLDRDDRPRACMYDAFDDIASQLRREGFHVVRNPLPLVVSENEEKRERMWYFATYNNAIVQVEGQTKNVWLPSYGYGDFGELKRTDRVNEQIWTGLGFKVNMLVDFHPYAHDLGAAHCIKKYLLR
jgi:hypothetical protein